MSSPVSKEELGEAILESVQHGTFPQSEHVASASVPSASIPHLIEVVKKARKKTKDEIRTASREAASDVDGWIAQARKLQEDIKRSQETAHEIVQQAEAGKEHAARIEDGMNKVSLLYSEVSYNETLVQVIERLRDISAILDRAQDAAVLGNTLIALDTLDEADNAFRKLEPFEATRVVGVLKNRADQLKAAIVENLTESWNALLVVDASARRVSFKETIERDGPVAIETVAEALSKLELLDSSIASLSRSFDRVIIAPRLAINTDHVVSSFDIQGDDVVIDGHVKDMSVKTALEDIHRITEYLSTRLPPSIALPLSGKIVPVIANRLISNWLLPAVPFRTDGVPEFQETLSFVLGLAEYLDELGWVGQDRLRDWVDRSAQVWLSRQKEAAIVRVHALCPKKVRDKESVERVETQIVSRGDAVLGHNEDEDEDWGADWGNDEEPESAEEPRNNDQATKTAEVEEEDMSAWDDNEPKEEPQPSAGPNVEEEKTADEEDVEAWGWGDEQEPEQEAGTDSAAPESSEAPKDDRPQANNGASKKQSPASNTKELTLRETYTITGVPDAIIDIIVQVVSDVGALNQPELRESAIAPASIGLYGIPSLALAMYRATAMSHYSRDVAGNMLIYNDCTRLSDKLRAFLQEQMERDNSSTLPPQLRPSVALDLTDDIKAIERFGKRAYGREMEAQRTIIKDLLGGAQGFKTCTTPPFDAECDNAIAMAIDRIEEVKRQWQHVLSHSALLQSLGSLVSTALVSFISDVEEMSDISEEESKKLHSYCTSLSSLSSLFRTTDDSGNVQDMVSVYTPNWFKFQYLAEILDSSLADIRYFWTDGELKLEMDAEEVVDLIKALFAESEHRRKAISEIRRTSMK